MSYIFTNCQLGRHGHHCLIKIPTMGPVLGLGLWVGGVINRILFNNEGEATLLNPKVNKQLISASYFSIKLKQAFDEYGTSKNISSLHCNS